MAMFGPLRQYFVKSEIRACWKLLKPWWVSEERWIARGLFLLVFLLDMAIVAIGVWLTYWNKNFFNAFADYDLHRVWLLMLEALLIAACGIVSEASRTWFYQTLQIRWRRWMTDVYLKKWLEGSTFHRIEDLKKIDNADQRISEDLRDMVELSLHLSLGFFSNLVSLITFSIIIWGISGTLTFAVGGLVINIPGYMLWVSIIYAILASVMVEKWGKKMVAVEYEQQLRESDFRFSMMRVRENSAQIAISRGGTAERKMLNRFFRGIEINWEAFKQYTKRITIVEKGYTEIGILLAYLVIIPRYFAHQITLGSIMQLTMSFTKVRVGFAWFVFQYKRLASLRSMCKRLGELYCYIDMETPRHIAFETSRDGALRIDNLELSLADGKVITRVDALCFEPGSRWLIRGGSGVGKTTLLKAIAGVWLYGSGRISLPDGKFMFLPQELYLPLGTLRVALCYPRPLDAYTPGQCAEALFKCGLGQYIGCLDDEGILWSKRLSPGEKQRLAFARCLLGRPDFLFMDESTSALDPAMEQRLFECLLDELPDTAIISVAHRLSLDKYHDNFYTMGQVALGSDSGVKA